MRSRDRTLGDVPGIEDLIAPIPASGPGITEVDGNGIVTTAELALGDVAGYSGTDYDPFSFDFAQQSGGMWDLPPEGGGVNPMSHLYMGGSSSGGGTSYSGGSSSTGGGSYYVGDVAGFDEEQRNNAATIIEVGKDVGATDRDIQTAIMAAIVESGLRNLDYGDRDSIGMFQQRDAWGSREARLDPRESARMFFLGGAGGQQGLLDKKDRDKMSLGEAAQAVQVSAFPDRYADHEQEAGSLMSAMGTTSVQGGWKGKDPYGRTTVDGHELDNITAAALQMAEKKYGQPIQVTQGSFSHSVAASGDTHAGGGALDIMVTNGNWDGAVAALRKVGFAAWHRTPDQGPWPEHIHAVLIGDEQLSDQAQQQVQSYLNDDNGLVGSTVDDGPRDWVGVRFKWEDVTGEDPLERDRHTISRSAVRRVGTPFKWGGEDHAGVDNLGLLRSVYSELGMALPKSSIDMPLGQDAVPASQAKTGDIIGWHDDLHGAQYGVYVGNGLVVAATRPGAPVEMNTLEDLIGAYSLDLSDMSRSWIDSSPLANRDPVPTNTSPYTSFDSTPRGYGTSTYTPHHAAPSGGFGSTGSSVDATPNQASTPGPSGGGGGGGKKKKHSPPLPPNIPDFGV